jgi:AraC-like DNA-binding protein
MPAWPEVALECGYFDQSHLCHDWAEFTGFAPVDFLRRRNVGVKEHHIALPEPATSNFSKTPGASRA